MVARLWKILGYVAGVAGFIAAILAIYQWLTMPGDPNQVQFVESIDERPYIMADTPSTSELVQDEVAVVGQIEVPDQFLLIANNIDFHEDAILSIPSGGAVLIVAVKISGGLLKANGEKGTKQDHSGGDGSPGGSAGEVSLVAVNVTGFSIDARGGQGGDGKPGANGQNGRDGRCDGFGRWRKANPGGDGQNGGAAGAGGPGGQVYLYGPVRTAFDPKVSGGDPGAPGAPGHGGSGGQGCTGLGGSQASRAPGKDGLPGATALPGHDGQVYRSNLPLAEFSQRLRTLVDNNSATYSTVKQLIAQLSSSHD